MKKILLSIVALMATFTANAQLTTDVTDLKIAAGEEKEVIFSLKTEEAVTMYEFWLVLPEGIEIATEDDEYLVDFVGSRHVKSHSYMAEYKSGSTSEFLISVTSNKSANLKELEGEVLSVTFKATADVKSPITIKDAYAATAAEVKIPFEDFVIKVNEGTAINSISAEQTKSGVIYNMNGQRVSKATKGIYVVDGKKVAVK